MQVEIDYKEITLQDAENYKHGVLVCDGDSKKVKVESEDK